MSELPTWADVEGVARLVGDLADPKLTPAERDQRFLLGTAAHLEAKLGFLIRAEYTGVPDQPVRLVSIYDCGLGERERALIEDYTASNGQDDPTILPTVTELVQSPVHTPKTWLLSDVIAPEDFHAHPHYRLCEAIGSEDRLMVSVRISEQRLVCVSLHRAPGARPFGERERRLAKILFEQAGRALIWNHVPLGGFLRRQDGTVLDLKRAQPPAEELFGLSKREAEVARWVARGLSNKEIAQELNLSPETVKRHVSSALRKSHSESRTELAYLVLTLRGQG
ncbi:MAG: LuxR C-terminal-related transcriptional regulator [Planctomycetota bacterium]